MEPMMADPVDAMMHHDVNQEVISIEETRYLLRSPGFVAVLSALVMGLGQFFNGQVRKALVFFLAEVGVFLYFLDYLTHRVVADTLIHFVGVTTFHVFLGTLVVGGVVLWIFNIVDAYRVAQFLSFIYDRSIPQVVEDDESFYVGQVQLGPTPIRIRRGLSRKGAFLGVAVAAYTLALLTLGSRYISRSEEMQLLAELGRNPDDAAASLRLGEIYLARGWSEKAEQQFERVLKMADDLGERRLAYHAYTNLARLYAGIQIDTKANQMLKNALSLLESDDDDDAGGGPGGAGGAGSPRIAPAGAPSMGLDEAVRAVTLVKAVDAGRGAGAFPVPPVEVIDPGAGSAGTDRPGPDRTPVAPSGDREAAARRLLESARSSVELKKYSEALRTLRLSREKGADGGDYHELMGRALVARGAWRAALTHLGQARAGGVKDPELALLAARALVKTGEKEAAVVELESYDEARPGDRKVLAWLTDLLVQTGRFEKASSLVVEALVDDPDSVVFLTRDFQIALRTRNEERAYQAAAKVIRDKGHNGEVIKGMIQESLDRRHPDLASRICSVFIERRPTDPAAYHAKARVLMHLEDRTRALGYLEKAAALGYQEADLYEEISEIYLALGRSKDAVRSLEAAAARRPEDPGLQKALAELAMRIGDPGRALEIYQRLLDRRPDGEIALGLARAATATGDSERGRKILREILRRSPGHPEATRLLRQLESGRSDGPPARGEDEGPVGESGHVGTPAVTLIDSPARAPLDLARFAPPPPPSREAPSAPMAPPPGPRVPAGGTPPARAASTPGGARDPTASDSRGSARPADLDPEEAAVLGAPTAGESDDHDPEDAMAAWGAMGEVGPGTPAPARPRAALVPGAPGDGPARAPAVRPPGAVGTGSGARPGDPLPRARAMMGAGQIAEAIPLLRAAAAARPDRFEARYDLARALRDAGQPYEALTEYEEARRLRPRDPALLIELGQLYTSLNMPEQAVSVLEGLVELDPGNLAGRYALGVNYEKLKSYSRAEEQYRLISHYHPQYLEAHDYLGNLYFSQGRFPLASEAYRRILEGHPSDVRARFKLAVSLYNQREMTEARKEFQHLYGTLDRSHNLHAKVAAYIGRIDGGT